MHFGRAEYLNFLWAVPLLAVFLFWSLSSRRRRLERFISPSLAPQLTEEFSRWKAALRVVLLLGFFAFGILALARPQWGAKLETVRRHGVDIIVGLDTSYSMNTEDVAPNRLAKAKSEIQALLGSLRGDRIGIVTFAGSAVVECPLTLDYGAASLFLDVANTEIVPEPGTSLAAAIETATSAFIAKERKYKVLILFTDGEDLEGQVDSAADKAKDAGVIIYAVGIGTPQGKPIPIRDPKGDIVEYRKDPSGQVVISSLDERSLAEIASRTGGRYFRATTSENEIDSLYDDISKLEKKELESRLYQNYEDQFQYPLAVALLCLMGEAWIGERRKPGQSWFQKVQRWRIQQPESGIQNWRFTIDH
jgi:Ca-activated chloride channel family protein